MLARNAFEEIMHFFQAEHLDAIDNQINSGCAEPRTYPLLDRVGFI